MVKKSQIILKRIIDEQTIRKETERENECHFRLVTTFSDNGASLKNDKTSSFFFSFFCFSKREDLGARTRVVFFFVAVFLNFNVVASNGKKEGVMLLLLLGNHSGSPGTIGIRAGSTAFATSRSGIAVGRCCCCCRRRIIGRLLLGRLLFVIGLVQRGHFFLVGFDTLLENVDLRFVLLLDRLHLDTELLVQTELARFELGDLYSRMGARMNDIGVGKAAGKLTKNAKEWRDSPVSPWPIAGCLWPPIASVG